MVVEGAVDAISKDEDPPEFSRTEISDFVGCSKDTIRRIEKEALRKVEKHLLQSKE
jgi:DNA-directed RNA polymerase sigma subunit (sigma70/sigma32)